MSAGLFGTKIVQVSGPVIIADLIETTLFGCLSVQLYLYYQAFPKDRLFVKIPVYTVYIIEFVTTILIIRDAFERFGYGFTDTAALVKINLTWFTSIVVPGLVAFFTQSFYAYRIYVLSKSRLIPFLIAAIAATSSITSFICGAFLFEAANGTLLNTKRMFITVGVWLATSAVCDFIIAGYMTYWLIKHDVEFRQTHAMVSKLIRLIVGTGSLTAAVALTSLTLFFASSSTSYYAAPGAVMPTVYANSMLVVLNSRIKIAGGRGTGASDDVIISEPRFRHTTQVNEPAVVSIRRELSTDSGLDDQVEMKVVGTSHSA
ncbi:hypothetical protein B0H11DRAFT_2031874 [Mycena galericulata]|nr:hypothetical protein B0H11DRAFT_2031874 [Mycena galericulata]